MPSKYKKSASDYRHSPHSGVKKAKTGTDADLDLVSLLPLFTDEDKAREFVEAKRWPDGIPFCPHCGEEGYALTPKPGSKSPGRKGLKKCKGCRKQFSVRVGTVLEESKIPISKWLMAIHLMTTSKKGVSSHQIARQLDITQKTAWFLCHRIREAMREDGTGALLTGTVEVDETYVGGKPRPGTGPHKRGRGTSKQPVMVLVERDGKSKAFPVADASGSTLKGEVRKLVHPTAAIHTDECSSYRGLGKEFAGGHHAVNHSEKEYVRYADCGEVFVSTNTAESWFALLKRGHYGIFHQLSKIHLHRYCDERSFMWNNRKTKDGNRLVAVLDGAEGKRLKYR